jgi:hypothetical protein
MLPKSGQPLHRSAKDAALLTHALAVENEDLGAIGVSLAENVSPMSHWTCASIKILPSSQWQFLSEMDLKSA